MHDTTTTYPQGLAQTGDGPEVAACLVPAASCRHVGRGASPARPSTPKQDVHRPWLAWNWHHWVQPSTTLPVCHFCPPNDVWAGRQHHSMGHDAEPTDLHRRPLGQHLVELICVVGAPGLAWRGLRGVTTPRGERGERRDGRFGIGGAGRGPPPARPIHPSRLVPWYRQNSPIGACCSV